MLRRKIYTGVEETADESMSAIRFWTTPKGDLPHYWFILSKLKPLETELKNAVCDRLGVMLYLDIQKGEEFMKASDFQQQIGCMADFM